MEEEVRTQLEAERDLAARQAIEALGALRQSLADAAAEITQARHGGAARSDLFIPSHQRMQAVIEYGAKFGALWNAAGIAKLAEAQERDWQEEEK